MAQPRIEDAIVGTVTAAEILGQRKENAKKTLERHGARVQTVSLGTREMAVWLRSDVERIALKLSDDRRKEAEAKPAESAA